MRLFVGLALSDEAKTMLERVTLRLRGPEDGLRWPTVEQWHITLVFLGVVEDRERAVLLRALRKIRATAVSIEINGLGTFDRAGVLYAAVEITPGLLRLQQTVAETIRMSGFALEERPYKPHITLARSRNRGGSQTLQRLGAVLAQQRLQVSWTAEEFLLYESELSPTGSRYRVRERFALTKS
ncbi:MAG TPA: RNA 2',3'-cyclic phosphodiesterase [Gemmatimonadales bacterium]|jgi:2'-5' RNA ligase|nr:RNA 2',3'-cyclic phosphodiesterase [Gemmatimonadales bacterium]